jgi:beta-glucanase (GH16 family)
MHGLGACARIRRPRGRRLLGALTLLGVAVACAVPPPPIPETGWALVFGDGFEGTELKPIWAGAPFVDSLPATVADGILTLRSTAANGHQWGYLATTGPRIEGEPSYPYAAAWQEGYVEARVRYSNDRWARPAMWMFSMAKTEAWPGEDCSLLNAEWDIMENGIDVGDGSRPANDWVTSAIHRNTTDNTPDGYCGLPDVHQYASTPSRGVDLSSWHTWAGRWTAAELCTYVDDVLVHCLPTYDTTAQPMHLVLSIGYLGACTGCPPPPAEMEMQVDWVRVWQRR